MQSHYLLYFIIETWIPKKKTWIPSYLLKFNYFVMICTAFSFCLFISVFFKKKKIKKLVFVTHSI